jgi:hypothetical protein
MLGVQICTRSHLLRSAANQKWIQWMATCLPFSSLRRGSWSIKRELTNLGGRRHVPIRCHCAGHRCFRRQIAVSRSYIVSPDWHPCRGPTLCGMGGAYRDRDTAFAVVAIHRAARRACSRSSCGSSSLLPSSSTDLVARLRLFGAFYTDDDSLELLSSPRWQLTLLMVAMNRGGILTAPARTRCLACALDLSARCGSGTRRWAGVILALVTRRDPPPKMHILMAQSRGHRAVGDRPAIEAKAAHAGMASPSRPWARTRWHFMTGGNSPTDDSCSVRRRRGPASSSCQSSRSLNAGVIMSLECSCTPHGS